MYIASLIIIILLLILVFIHVYFLLNFNNYSDTHSDSTCFPKIIFQTWKSKDIIPDNMNYWMNTWKIHNQNYNHHLWDDTDNRNFIEQHFGWFLPVYDNYPKNINRVDAVRYFFLYHYGGIYADMDFECLQSFDSLLQKNNNFDIILGSMESQEYHQHNIPNAIMISKPKQNFWLVVMYFLIANKDRHSVEEQTGPVMLKEAYEFYKNNKDSLHKFLWYNELVKLTNHSGNTNSIITVLTPNMLYPVSWDTDQSSRQELLSKDNYADLTQHMKEKYSDAYAVTYWTHSW